MSLRQTDFPALGLWNVRLIKKENKNELGLELILFDGMRECGALFY